MNKEDKYSEFIDIYPLDVNAPNPINLENMQNNLDPTKFKSNNDEKRKSKR